MRILVIGGGGREHALAWKLAQSPLAERVYVAPGNAGTAVEKKVENVALDVLDFEALRGFAEGRKAGLVVVGPEAPLAQDIVTCFQQAGLPILAPTRVAAQLEWSKCFSKKFMWRHGIPTAAGKLFDDESTALKYLKSCQYPAVIKADGLAAGKGVVVVESYSQAAPVVHGMLSGDDFGAAGKRVVVEEFLCGEEASFICMVAGEQVLPLATSQDHKTRDEGGRGPNTGGMGAYSPAPLIHAALQQRVLREIVQPAVAGMCAEGKPFFGFLYVGLMISSESAPAVLEFNCRLGDPEAQVILMRLRSDLVELCCAMLDGRLDRAEVDWDERVALGVVMSAAGYPGEYRRGDPVQGLESVRESGTVKVFHSGTRLQNGEFVTAGGRVLCVTALADSIAAAQACAYRVCGKISWEGRFYRRDIGYQAVSA